MLFAYGHEHRFFKVQENVFLAISLIGLNAELRCFNAVLHWIEDTEVRELHLLEDPNVL